MHLSQPVLRCPGLLIPAYDDAPVSPALVLHNLPHSEGDMGGPGGSRLDTLAEISVFVSEHENLTFLFSSRKIFWTIFYHLFSRTFTIGIIQTIWIQDIFYIECEDPLTPPPPGIQPQPGVSHLMELTDKLGNSMSPAGLCAAHVAGYKHLQGDTQHYHGKLKVFSLERHLLSLVRLTFIRLD